jgi:hypothetical protein
VNDCLAGFDFPLDCDESFRIASQLVKHHGIEHRHDSPKPAAAFFAPILGPLPVAPKILPSYMVEARQVQQPSISKERHTSLISSVSWSYLCGDVALHV